MSTHICRKVSPKNPLVAGYLHQLRLSKRTHLWKSLSPFLVLKIEFSLFKIELILESKLKKDIPSQNEVNCSNIKRYLTILIFP